MTSTSLALIRHSNYGSYHARTWLEYYSNNDCELSLIDIYYSRHVMYAVDC